MFLLGHTEGKGTDKALLMLPLLQRDGQITDRRSLYFARADSSSEHRDNDDSSALAALLSPSLSKPGCKAAGLISCFFLQTVCGTFVPLCKALVSAQQYLV